MHGILRRYHGWFDGNPAHLFPSPAAEIAREVTALTGTGRLLDRAREIAAKGDAQLALHLVDLVLDAGDVGPRAEAQGLKAELLAARAAAEPSFIARSILRNGAEAAAVEARRVGG